MLKKVSMGHQNILTLVDYFETMNNRGSLFPLNFQKMPMLKYIPSLPRHGPRPRWRTLRPNMQKRKLLRIRRGRPHPRNPLRRRLPPRPRHRPPRPKAREPPLPNTRRQRRPPNSRLRPLTNHGRRSLPRPHNHLRNTRLHGAGNLQKDRSRQTSVSTPPPFLPSSSKENP